MDRFEFKGCFMMERSVAASFAARLAPPPLDPLGRWVEVCVVGKELSYDVEEEGME